MQCWSTENWSDDSLYSVGAPAAFQFERRLSLLLAVDETEFQLNGRRSFEEFVGLDVINDIHEECFEDVLNLGEVESCIHEKGSCNHPLSDAAKERNQVGSAIRTCVEHVLGYNDHIYWWQDD